MYLREREREEGRRSRVSVSVCVFKAPAHWSCHYPDQTLWWTITCWWNVKWLSLFSRFFCRRITNTPLNTTTTTHSPCCSSPQSCFSGSLAELYSWRWVVSRIYWVLTDLKVHLTHYWSEGVEYGDWQFVRVVILVIGNMGGHVILSLESLAPL